MNLRTLSLLLLVSAGAASCTTASHPEAAGKAPSGEEARLVRLAADVERRGDRKTALALYERAVKVSSNVPAANVRLGNARLAAGEPDSAASAFRGALDAEAQNPAALLGLGTAQLRAGQVESAARTLAVASPLVKTPSAYNRLGTALVLTGDGNGAFKAFSAASSLDPGNLDTRSNLALAEVLAGRNDEAIAGMRQVTASPRAEARHFRNLMLVMTLAGRDADAAAVAVPDYPEAEKRKFLADAGKVRKIKAPADRARAIGLLAAA